MYGNSMARPKSDDPKDVVTLRLRRSTLARFKAGGDNWRVRMEALLEEHQGAVVAARVVRELRSPQSPVHVSVPLISRPAFNPRPKTGKR